MLKKKIYNPPPKKKSEQKQNKQQKKKSPTEKAREIENPGQNRSHPGVAQTARESRMRMMQYREDLLSFIQGNAPVNTCLKY